MVAERRSRLRGQEEKDEMRDGSVLDLILGVYETTSGTLDLIFWFLLFLVVLMRKEVKIWYGYDMCWVTEIILVGIITLKMLLTIGNFL